MKKKKQIKYILFFLFLSTLSLAQTQEQTLFISTGAYGGNYQKVGEHYDGR